MNGWKTVPVMTIIAAMAVSCTSTRHLSVPLPLPPKALGNEPVLVPVPGDPTVSYKIAFQVGSEYDPEGKEGLAYLTAALMAEGATQDHGYAEILDLLFPMAASYSVRVDVEQTTFSGRVHRDYVDPYTRLLLDALLRPAFREDDFERIRDRTIDYLTTTLRYSSDEELGKAALFTSVFRDTSYGHLSLGTVDGLEAITLDDVRDFYSTYFTRDTVVVGIGGGYTPELVGRLERALSTLSPGRPAPRPAPRMRTIDGREVVIVSKPGPATAISFGFPIDVHRGDDDYYALWLANSWLGEHRNASSHLYQVIREARGLNYGDYSYIEYFPEGGRRQMPPPNVPRRQQLFEVWVRPVPSDAALFALRAAVREVDRLVASGMTREQFELTRNFLLKYSLHFADTTSARLGYALDDRFYDIPEPGHLALFRQKVKALTLAAVNGAIRRHLSTRDMVIAMVAQNAETLADAIASDAPSPISYATPKPDEVLREDEAIATYPLGIDRQRITVVPVDRMFQD